jgi:hypothetical protein
MGLSDEQLIEHLRLVVREEIHGALEPHSIFKVETETVLYGPNRDNGLVGDNRKVKAEIANIKLKMAAVAATISTVGTAVTLFASKAIAKLF